MGANQFKLSPNVVVFAVVFVVLVIGIYIWNDARIMSENAQELLFPANYIQGWQVIQSIYAIAFYKIMLIGCWAAFLCLVLILRSKNGIKNIGAK